MSRILETIKHKSSQLRGWLQGPFSRIEAILILGILFLFAFSFFQVVNSSNQHDQIITGAIGVTFLAMLAGMMVWTKTYSWLSLALIMLFIGDLLLYFFLTDSYSGEDKILSNNTRAYWVRAVRAAFTVGCNLMLINIFYLWRDNIKVEIQEEE